MAAKRLAPLTALLLLQAPSAAAAAPADCRSGGAPTASPALVVDPADPARHLPFALLEVPGASNGVRGGLERFRLRADGVIVDRAGQSAVNPAGSGIADTAVGEWGQSAPAPLYTDVVTGPLRVAANSVGDDNAKLGAAELGLAAGDAAARSALIHAILMAGRGAAVPADGLWGAHGASTLAWVEPGTPDRGTALVALVATGDGLLRAVDASTGAALWVFAPLERIGRAGAASAQRAARRGTLNRIQLPPTRAGGLPRTLVVFAGGAGSTRYFGFDLSDIRAPALLWRAGLAELPLAAVRRAPATIARIRIAGARQNDAQAVLIAGGGDAGGEIALSRNTPRRGNSLFMLDIVSGELLWHAARAGENLSGARAPLELARLDAPIAAGIRAIDLNGDGFAERLYAADLGGRVWRFDVHNGESSERLVSGGVFASLGAADGGGPADARRFYQAPDVAFLRDGTQSFLQVAIGSGGGGGTVQDYFYALRDYELGASDAATAGAGGAIAPRVLTNATSFADPAQGVLAQGRAPGWRLAMRPGEAVAGEARTFASEVLFVSAGPAAHAAPGCAVPLQLYALDARSGAVPAGRAGRSMELPRAARAPPLMFAFPPRASALAAECGARADGCNVTPACFVGLARCGTLPPLAALMSVWKQLDPGP